MPEPLAAGELALGLSVALGAGLLIGLERERRKGRGADRRAAGIRSFSLAALAGALGQGLGEPLLVVAGAASVAGLALVAYWRSQRTPGASRDPGLTTELALVVTFLVGVLAMAAPALGAAAAVVVAVLLASRERLHRFATQALSEAELHDALLLAALALVALPLAPPQPLYWSAGLAPRTVLAVLVLILLLQGAGHVATRLYGARAGLALSGLFSGFVSSTATIASMGARWRGAGAAAPACEAGAVLSTAATWIQAVVMLGAISPGAALRLAPAAAAGGLVAGAWGWARARSARGGEDGTESARERGPLRVREAALVALLLAAVTLGVGWAQRAFGDAGVFAGAALGALADAHASIAALATLHAAGQLEDALLVPAVMVAVGANAVTRSITALVAGGWGYGWRIALSLLASTGAAVLVAGLTA